MKKGSNPVFDNLLNGERFNNRQVIVSSKGVPSVPAEIHKNSRPITIDDIVTKTAVSLGLLFLAALVSYFFVDQHPETASVILLISGLIGFGVVFWSTIKQKYNAKLTLTYSVLEGVVVGCFSEVLSSITSISSSIITQAIFATICVVAAMLVVYRTGVIRVTPQFTKLIVASMLGAILLMMLDIIVSFFHAGGLGLRGSGPGGIVFSLVMIVLAAFSLLINFDEADSLVRAEAPVETAWGVALGLMVTIVWIYTEILRLLFIVNSD